MKSNPRDVVSISGVAVTTLRLKNELTMAELVRRTNLSRNTLTSIESNRTSTMQRTNAQIVATALGVTLDAILRDKSEEPLPNTPILGYMGLKEIPVEYADDVPLTVWELTSTNQPLAYAWWALGDQLWLERPIKGEHICVHFESENGTMPVNIGCHPYDHTPRLLTASQTAIAFGAYVVTGTNLAIGVRVTDKKGREWVFADETQYSPQKPMHQFNLKPKAWTPCVINLLLSQDRWHLFRITSADRIRNLRPDFSVISRVVIEFGTSNPAGRPGAGKGQVWLSPLWVGRTNKLTQKIQRLAPPIYTAPRKAGNRKTNK